MSMMERILRLMAERKASDVYLSPYAPALIKINGQCVPINARSAGGRFAHQPACRGAAADRIEELKDDRRAEHGHAHGRRGQFPYQRHAPAGHLRGGHPLHLRKIPTLPSLKVPPILADLVMEKRGLMLVVGATGAGKSTTLAAMLDHRNARASDGPHPDH
jgi:twitching motility protein PilU